MLPPRLSRKSDKADKGKRSPAHRAWVRGHADAIVAVSDQIIANANFHLKAAQLIAQHGDRFKKSLPMIEGPSE